jgi:endonuclease/exonuclease/phosphatase family metal-dependent hydrolase
VRTLLAASIAVPVVLLGGCDLLREAPAPDAAPSDADGPRTDAVPPVGGPDTLDILAWNIENMPKSDRTVHDVEDLVASMDLDLVMVEEVASVDAWDAIVAALPQHDGVLSPHRYTAASYQKLGLLYRADEMTVTGPELLFTSSMSAFPRPPMLVHVTLNDGWTVDVVGVHLKAGVAQDDVDRRRDAVEILEQWLRAQVDGGGEDEIIVLGDWNATLDADRPDLTEVWPPITDAPDRYTIRTAHAAASGATSYLPFGTTIDHIVTTAGLADEVGDRDAIVVPLANEYSGYEDEVSDHQPVELSFPLPTAG